MGWVTRLRPTCWGPLAAALLVPVALSSASCSEGEGPSRDADEAPRASDPRPSVVLVVVESLRTDVVGSYGRDPASPFPADGPSATPHLDALSGAGFRYAWAIAASPETAASHASLFSGLRADEHGVGLWARPVAPESLTTIAERLREAGYQTAGFSENPMVGPDYGLAQGFEIFHTPGAEEAAAGLAEQRDPAARFGLVDRVRRWHAERDPAVPYFLFVNLFDPHLPLEAGPDDPFLPEDVGPARVASLVDAELRTRICRRLPDPDALAIVRGLYRSEVAAADRKLGAIVALTGDEPPSRPITIVTADHGTHLGERGLLGHQFELDNRALRVPLVVHGSPLGRGLVETPVAQRRLAASIRCWTGDPAACEAALPAAEPAAPAPIFSIYGDERAALPPAAVVDTGSLRGDTNHARVSCDRSDGPFGRAVSLIRPPMKMVWRSGAAPRLYDLRWDVGERSDQMELSRGTAVAMRDEIESWVREKKLDRVRRDAPGGTLRERAAAAFDEARTALLGGGSTRSDTVWFVQLLLRERDDPELARWVEQQIPLHEQDPYFAIIAPDRSSPGPLPKDPGHGVERWWVYLRAAVADPEPLALRYLEEYLGAREETGYILTHQVSALEWARAKGRPLDPDTYERLSFFLERMAEEHEADPVFSDLWVERAAFLAAFGNPPAEALERWASVLVENHLGGGDWGDGPIEITYDGQTVVGRHPREHTRGLAMIVLDRYLDSTPHGRPSS